MLQGGQISCHVISEIASRRWLVVLLLHFPLIEILVIVFVTNYNTTVGETQCRYHVCI